MKSQERATSIPVKSVGLNVSDAPSHIFRGYGMYIGECGKVDEDVRKTLAKKIFEGLNARVIHYCFEMAYPNWNPKHNDFNEGEEHLDPYDTDALDAWITEHTENLGYGGREFAADMKKYGAVYAMNMCGVLPHNLSDKTVAQIYAGANEDTLAIVRGNGADTVIVSDGAHPIKDSYISTLVDTAVNLVERMIKKFDMPVKYISVFDEPNFGAVTPHQMCRIIKLTRKKLDEKGLNDILINGPASAGINLSYAAAVKSIDPEAFALLDKITVHGFGSGMMDLIHKQQVSELGKELWITSAGAAGDGNFCDLPRNEKGEIIDNSNIYGVVNASAFLIDVNLGASYMGNWQCLAAPKHTDILMQYYMFLADKTADCSVLGKKLLITKYYEYISAILAAINADAEIYCCESSEEGCMSERYDLTNSINNQMSALAAKNNNGKWGIAILNKTDTETRRIELNGMYENTKPHNLAGHSVYLNVELDIQALYGTGEKRFEILKTGKEGKYLKPGGTITVTDGKGTVGIAPFELVAMREI